MGESSALAPLTGGSSVAPARPPEGSVVEEVEAHVAVLLRLCSAQIPPKRWDEDETESTVFRAFLSQIQQNVNWLKEKEWVGKGYDKLSEAEQLKLFPDVFRIGRVYSDYFGGGTALSDLALQEFAALRASGLETGQVLKTLYEHVQRPQPGRPLQQLFNFGGHFNSSSPNIQGVAAGRYFREQSMLKFMSHSIRESEDFTVAKHRNGLGGLANKGWDLPESAFVKSSEQSGQGAGGGSRSDDGDPEAPVEPKEGEQEQDSAAVPSVADVSHQFKTMCFAYNLLQRTGLGLNVYNSYYFLPGRESWLIILTCFTIQVIAPFFLAAHQAPFMKELWSQGGTGFDDPWNFISVLLVILLFNIVNAEIFSKQVRNTLLTRRLRNVVWNSDGEWKATLIAIMDLYTNIINPCITAVVINIVLFSSSDVLDSILNALALNFIIEVDEFVVRNDLDDAQLMHDQELPAKVVAFLRGDSRMASTYHLSEEPEEGLPARRIFHNAIHKQYKRILPLIIAAFAIPFLILTVLSTVSSRP